MKEKKIDRTEVKRLLKELNEKDKETNNNPFSPLSFYYLEKA